MNIPISKTDTLRMLKYLNDAAQLYDTLPGQRNVCRAWVIREIVTKINRRVKNSQTTALSPIIHITPITHMNNETTPSTRFDDLVSKAKTQKPSRKKPDDEEHRIQRYCVRWFNLQYPQLRGRLFAVPNGGRRDATTGAKLKAEGVTAGVSDLILLIPNHRYGALLIEMKTPKGTQSDQQQKWQRTVTANDEYRYTICRSLDDFIREVTAYLNNE